MNNTCKCCGAPLDADGPILFLDHQTRERIRKHFRNGARTNRYYAPMGMDSKRYMLIIRGQLELLSFEEFRIIRSWF